jgi:hypothetical protein
MMMMMIHFTSKTTTTTTTTKIIIITLHVTQIVHTEQLQYSIPEKHVFFFSYIIVNTLHKADKNDDDNNNDKGVLRK